LLATFFFFFVKRFFKKTAVTIKLVAMDQYSEEEALQVVKDYERKLDKQKDNFDQRTVIYQIFDANIWENLAITRYWCNDDEEHAVAVVEEIAQSEDLVRPAWHKYNSHGESQAKVEEMYKDYVLLDGGTMLAQLIWFLNFYSMFLEEGAGAEWLRKNKSDLYDRMPKSLMSANSHQGGQFLMGVQKKFKPLLLKMIDADLIDEWEQSTDDNRDARPYIRNVQEVFTKFLTEGSRGKLSKLPHDICKVLLDRDTSPLGELVECYINTVASLNRGLTVEEIRRLVSMCVGPIPDAWAPGICLASLEGFLTNGPPTTSIRDAGKDFFPLPSIQDVIGRKDPESMEFKFDMGLLFFASGYRFDNNARPVYEYWESLPDRESSRELTFEQVARSKASEQLRLVIDHVQFEAGEIPSSNWAYILKATVALKTPSQQTRLISYTAQQPHWFKVVILR